MFRSAGRLPTRQNSSPKRASPLRLVRHAAKDGSLPAERNIKKHHRFFQWVRKHIHRRPCRKEKPPGGEGRPFTTADAEPDEGGDGGLSGERIKISLTGKRNKRNIYL